MKMPFFVALGAATLLLTGCPSRRQMRWTPLSYASGSAAANTDIAEASVAMAQPSLLPGENLAIARKLAQEGEQLWQQPADLQRWQMAKIKLKQAIRLLEAIPLTTAIAPKSQQLLTTYRSRYTLVSRQVEAEKTASQKLAAAQKLGNQASQMLRNSPQPLSVWQKSRGQSQDAIALLQAIPAKSLFSSQARRLEQLQQTSLHQIRQHIATESKALDALEQFAEAGDRLVTSVPSSLASEQSHALNISYAEYARLVNHLHRNLTQFAQVPEAKHHPVYPELVAVMDDHQFALHLWNRYLAYKRANSQWLYDDLYNQLTPITPQDAQLLLQKYQVQTHRDGSKVSLRTAMLGTWQHAGSQITQARQAFFAPSPPIP